MDIEDPSCQCGYAESLPGVNAYTCKRFKCSAFFTMANEDMPTVQKYVGSKPLQTDGPVRR